MFSPALHSEEADGAESTRGLHPGIADRSNLLLKGSGRVNRVLGPDEESTGPPEKSLRQARRQRSLSKRTPKHRKVQRRALELGPFWAVAWAPPGAT
jgi:hypothetical protein